VVWLSKREVAYYLILKSKFDRNIFNLGEALDVLSLFGSKTIARKVIKRLRSKGFLECSGVIYYRIKSEEEALSNMLSNYIAQRLYRNLKSRGYSISLNITNQRNILKIYNCSDNILSILNTVRRFNIDIECILNENENLKNNKI
jgi:hypothetical protein